MTQHFDLLVVGGGPAGLATSRSYREAGGDGPVAIVTDEHRPPYRRPPLTKELLRGECGEADLPIEDEAWYAEQDIALVSGRAVALDSGTATVSLSGGRELEYDSCVLATGAEPKRLPVPGADDPAVAVLRTLDQLRELQVRLQPGVAVVVIGSGFIGCEIAASLRLRGHPVTQISDEPAPNQRRLGGHAAEMIAGWLHEYGVVLHAGATVQRIERGPRGLEVIADEARATGALVIMATGVAPRGELAAGAGIALQDGAVPVDAGMRTASPGVLAVGDVCLAENLAAGRRLKVEHWGDALGQGEIAGRTVAGQAAQWFDVPGFWSTIGRHTLKYAAWGDGYETACALRHDDGGLTVWYGRDGKVVGVLTYNADEDYERGGAMVGEGATWTW
jgi:3-phenylpropionate/trans-cinnamate dioxygenase ferredoxin reductase component